MLIDGIVYTAEDVGGAVKGNVIDIWVGDESNSLGLRYEKVYILEN